jgi:hypothetical protein
MSDKVEELARLILEISESGTLRWTLVPVSDAEEYHAEIGDEQFITIRRNAWGDDKVITLELSKGNEIILTGIAHNFLPFSASSERVMATAGLGSAKDLILNRVDRLKPDIERFRLFSDLFLAAKRIATGEGSAIARFQDALERLGKGAA